MLATMTDPTTTIDTYVAAFNEPDDDVRAKLVADVWTEDGRHVDPLDDVGGHDAIAAYMAGVQSHYPGHRVERTSGIDTHHDALRFGWRLVGPDGTVIVHAVDVAQLDGDGRLHRVTSFFGDLPVQD